MPNDQNDLKKLNSFSAKENYELSMLEYINPFKAIENESLDMLICLSGRGTFEGKFATADQVKFKAQGIKRDLTNVNTFDTWQRMAMTVCLHKLYFRNTGKRIPIFFNGVKEQNDQLRNILAAKGEYLGVPKEHFIVDDIPLDNTVGQAIGLRVFVENNQHLFDKDGPRLVLISDTYHIRRVSQAFGSNSPLFTPDFYKKEFSAKENKSDAILNKLSTSMKRQVLTANPFIAKSKIYAYGKDRLIMRQLGAEKDLKGDCEAVINYSMHQSPPSISSVISDNVMQYRKALVWMSFKNAEFFEGFIAKDTVQLAAKINGMVLGGNKLQY